MGTFTTKIRGWNPADPANVAEIEVWVDTGAAYSWFSRERLGPLGIQPTRRMQFQTIEGRTIECGVAPVFLSADGYSGGDSVVLGEPDDMEVIGAHSLESLGLVADPVRRRLIPTVLLALAALPEHWRGSRDVAGIG